MPVIMKAMNPADKKRGIVGYYQHVMSCPFCGAPANTIFRTIDGRRKVACGQLCADRIRD